MRTSLQILLVVLVLACSPAAASASLVDVMAIDITWEVPQISPGPIVLNGHVTWDTVAQRQASSSFAWTVTGQGAYQGTFWESIWGAFIDNTDRALILEGIVTGPDPHGLGAPDHGYAYSGLGLPDGIGFVKPGVYSVEPGSGSGFSTGISWHTRDLGDVYGGAPISGVVRVGVPLPTLVTPSDTVRGALRRLSPPLQYVTALGATALLRAVAIPARLHSGLGAYGEYQADIDLRDVTIQVMESCNGLGFLVTLVIGAMTIVNSRRMALMLLAAAIPLALGANALRVAILSVGVAQWGVDFVRGPTLAHELAGWMTWSAALVALMGLAMLIARRHSVS